MHIDPKLIEKSPDSTEVEQCYRDLIYCVRQAFSFTLWAQHREKWDFHPSQAAVVHDSLLETSLLNIRSLDEFLIGRPKKPNKRKAADLTIDNLRDLGFAKPLARILTDEESRTISQLFAHITANRNIQRVPKENFPLGRYLVNTMVAYDLIFEFFADRFKAQDTSTWCGINSYRHHFKQLLESQTKLDQEVGFNGAHFYVSGTHLRII